MVLSPGTFASQSVSYVTAPLSLRRWQGVAIPLGLQDLEERGCGIIVATTGSGKSIALAEMIRRWREAHPEAEGKIVVTTPSKKLVEQLAKTFSDILGAHNVGRYYTKAKQWQRPVVVCCNASVQTLALTLRNEGEKVAVWLADEVHKTESDQFSLDADDADASEAEVADALRADRRLGFTATPFRSQEGETLRLWKRIVYVYPPAEALRDGVIVPWRVVGWDESREETNPDEVCAIMIRELGDRATRGPGVVNATTIEDAEGYVAFLAARGIEARPIHSKQRDVEQKANIEALRTGEIDCLVHVSMLVEGVDYPWLRWGCLRRAVGARVRFIQEVGRYIRAFEGKSEAVLLDPNDLFGTFQLTYEAALGWAEEEEGDPTVVRERKDIEDAEGKEPKERRAVRTSALGRYVRQLYIALLAEGFAAEGKLFGAAGAAWRQDEPTPEQLRILRGYVKKHAAKLEGEHSVSLTRIAAMPAIATKGIVSDSISLLAGLASVKGTWAPASGVALPPEQAFEAVALPRDERWYAAGGCRNGMVAAVLMRGSDVVMKATREQQPGDTWGSLTLYAVYHATTKCKAEAVVVGDADAVAMLNGTRSPTRKAAAYLNSIPPHVRIELNKNTNPAVRQVWKLLPRAVPA